MTELERVGLAVDELEALRLMDLDGLEQEQAATTMSVSQPTFRALAGVHPAAAFKLLIAIGRVVVSRFRAQNQKYIDSLLVPPAGGR